jgi:site-specific recombinase XerD
MKKQLLTLNSPKDLHTHTLRHTFACLCIAKGLQIQEISLLMGHTDIKTTQIYAKLELGAIKSNFLKIMDMRE